MTRGDKQAYSDKQASADKQKHQAQHIGESEHKAGRSKEDAVRSGASTANKPDGGGKKSGFGPGKDTRH